MTLGAMHVNETPQVSRVYRSKRIGFCLSFLPFLKFSVQYESIKVMLTERQKFPCFYTQTECWSGVRFFQLLLQYSLAEI